MDKPPRRPRLTAALTTLMFAFSPPILMREGTEQSASPLWELGIGGGGTYTPDYPGSDQSHFWGIPFPFFIYRGDFLHSDRRGGTRARFLHDATFEFNVSGGGALPSSSAHNDARAGMRSLEYLGELGPRLTFDLMKDADGNLLRLGIPVRAAFSTNGPRLTDRGLIFAPELLYDRPNIFGSSLDAFALTSLNFATRRFNDYYYSVSPEDARADRPAYRAKPGYFLSDLSVGVTVPIDHLNLKVYGYGTLEYLHGAANENSPLMRRTVDTSVSLVLIWVFAQSANLVSTED